MEKTYVYKPKRQIICSYCRVLKNRVEFYRLGTKKLPRITRYCKTCRARININVQSKFKERFIPRVGTTNKAKQFNKIITRSIYKDEFDYILEAQKNLINAHIIIRQMIEDRVQVKQEETMVIWNNFLLELNMLNKEIEGYKYEKGRNFSP